MQLNGTTLVDRSSRPAYGQALGLRTFFINDGVYTDPYEISSVQIFYKGDTLSPKTVLGAGNLVSATPLMTFAASGATKTDSISFAEGGYTAGDVKASGIYRSGLVGDFTVVLDQSVNLSGWDATTDTELAARSASAATEYVDIWTVKFTEASNYQILINDFSIRNSTFYNLTQPLQLTAKNTLNTKHIRFGETVNINIGTELTVQNKNLDSSIINLFKDTLINNAQIQIRKVAEGEINAPGQDNSIVTFAESIEFGEVHPEVTPDNTILYNWDTATSINASEPALNGGRLGTYSVQVKYTLLNQTIISPLFYLTVS
jgi:hypothetical protein